MESGDSRELVSCCEDILDSMAYTRVKTPEMKALLDEVYETARGLNCSLDEYTWECASDIVSQYDALSRKRWDVETVAN